MFFLLHFASIVTRPCMHVAITSRLSSNKMSLPLPRHFWPSDASLKPGLQPQNTEPPDVGKQSWWQPPLFCWQGFRSKKEKKISIIHKIYISNIHKNIHKWEINYLSIYLSIRKGDGIIIVPFVRFFKTHPNISPIAASSDRELTPHRNLTTVAATCKTTICCMFHRGTRTIS